MRLLNDKVLLILILKNSHIVPGAMTQFIECLSNMHPLVYKPKGEHVLNCFLSDCNNCFGFSRQGLIV